MLTHTHSAGGGGDKAMMIPHTTLEMDKSTTHRGDRTHSMARAQSLRLIDSHTHTHTHSTEGTKSERKKDERERENLGKKSVPVHVLPGCLLPRAERVSRWT